MVHEMKLRDVYFDKIRNKQKVYEIRLNDEKRQIINVGDVIFFKKEPDLKETLKTTVKDLIYFKSFSEMINNLPLREIGFEGNTKEEVENIYHGFYSVENQLKYGVVAIKVEVMDE